MNPDAEAARRRRNQFLALAVICAATLVSIGWAVSEFFRGVAP